MPLLVSQIAGLAVLCLGLFYWLKGMWRNSLSDHLLGGAILLLHVGLVLPILGASTFEPASFDLMLVGTATIVMALAVRRRHPTRRTSGIGIGLVMLVTGILLGLVV